MKSEVSVFHLYSLTELASDRKYLIRGKHMFKCQYWFQTVEQLKITMYEYSCTLYMYNKHVSYVILH